jgi:hypothetical protein
MRIISVAGATSKAGKTELAEQLIAYCSRQYHPVIAVKFTTTSDLPSPCPRGAPCTVCDLSDAFRIVTDPAILNQPRKNTHRFAVAGADQVLWVIARKSQLENAYQHLLAHIPDHALVIMEGSTITELCRPDLLFYIFANNIPATKWKNSASRILEKADVILRNRKKGSKDSDLDFPGTTLTIDLKETPAPRVDAIRDKIDLLIGMLSHAVQGR